MREHRRASLRLIALFILLTGIPLAVLGWLSWRLVEQDRALENQRAREQLNNAAALIAHELDRRLTDWEDFLAKAGHTGAPFPPSGTAYILLNDDGIVEHRGAPVPYYPKTAAQPEAPPQVFTEGEAEEFREGDCAKAAASYSRLAHGNAPPIQAAALMRLARCLRKLNRIEAALAAYATLASLEDASVGGAPAALVARRERIAIFGALHDNASRGRESELLRADLEAGRFPIDRATFDFYSEALDRPLQDIPGVRFAKAIETSWSTWRRQTAGRNTYRGDQCAIVAVWLHTSSGTAAMLGDVPTLVRPLAGLLQNLKVQLALEDSNGALWGLVSSENFQAVKSSRETGLPWAIHIASSDAAAAEAAWASRRNLLGAGFALMALVIATASYAVYRAVSRELGVARLQSDFVAAVSHEFRSPLTAMRHLTEMLEEGSAAPDRLMQYYRALGKESRRLHEMVESLLDFGRMESGRRLYQMEETSARELTERVMAEFRERATASAHRIELSVVAADPESLRVHADGEALSVALRNLLDNAIKYSPESSTVEVAIERRGGLAGISVRDHGPGLAKDEQHAVFRKFVRGGAARDLNVRGTGIGLTMADQIVRAHGGRIELTTEPARGACFTMWLPISKTP